MSNSKTDQNKYNLRFKDLVLEKSFKKSYNQVTIQPLRMGLISSMLLWLLTIGLLYLLEVELYYQMSMTIIVVIFPFFILQLYLIRKKRLEPYIELLATCSNIIAGILLLYLLDLLPFGINYMLPVLIFIIFFGTYQLRLRLHCATFSALIYLTLYLFLLFNKTEIDTTSVGIYFFLIIITFLFAVFASYLREKSERELFIKNLTIAEQKNKIETAHNELQVKSTEIIDSIKYAKRIQSAILPPTKLVKQYLKDSFILYKPKDVVAGDFYWIHAIGNKIIFAVADCTGHGVPGAMVSVVCNNALNRSVREYNLSEPGEILDKTREIVIQEFMHSEDDVKDGMDIALCSLEGSTLKYAGAHNPLWIIRNGEVLETKADKQPIGNFEKQTAFTTHIIELEKGDNIYIFSDGFVDQFGGEKGKKYKSTAFRELLLSIQSKTMENQKNLMDEAFETWRGHLEQIDDVCVIGFRV